MIAAAAMASPSLSSGRRAQPARRANPPRTSSLQKPFDATPSATPIQPPGFFPATTYFTDCLSALPRDIMKHITMLHEASGKLYRQEEELEKLLVSVFDIQIPSKRSQTTAQDGNTISALNGTHQAIANGDGGLPGGTEGAVSSDDAADIARREQFHGLRLMIHEILPVLDERNHVIATANEALGRHLQRLDQVYPAVKDEVSDEVKYGNPNHWAYIEKRKGKAGGTIGSRRDIGNAGINAIADALAGDTPMSRSESRREAMIARKRNVHGDSDFDQREVLVNGVNGKKPAANPRKRVAEGIIPTSLAAALPAAPGATHKKRKTEKAAATGLPHVAVGGPLIQNSVLKNKSTVMSPRGDHGAPEPVRKRARPANAAKRNNAAGSAQSPNLASSPVAGTFSNTNNPYRSSPVPGSSRPGTSRGRPNSSTPAGDNGNGRHRPSTADGLGLIAESPAFGEMQSNGTTHIIHPDGIIIPEDNPYPSVIETAAPSIGRTNSRGKHASPPRDHHAATSRSHRPSRSIDSTHAANLAAAAAAAEKPASKPRASHKKNAHSTSNVAKVEVNGGDDGDDEDEDEDANEPRYCYCQNVSFGEMVACDADDCAIEWFHMSCVGLEKAPGKYTKWYCDECKEKLKKGKVNGSSRRVSAMPISAS